MAVVTVNGRELVAEEIGIVSVDSGSLLVADPCRVDNDGESFDYAENVTRNLFPSHEPAEWKQSAQMEWDEGKDAVLFRTVEGDGMYAVNGLYEDGKLVGIILLTDRTDDDEDDLLDDEEAVEPENRLDDDEGWTEGLPEPTVEVGKEYIFTYSHDLAEADEKIKALHGQRVLVTGEVDEADQELASKLTAGRLYYIIAPHGTPAWPHFGQAFEDELTEPIQCVYCPSTFVNPDDLNDHLIVAHWAEILKGNEG